MRYVRNFPRPLLIIAAFSLFVANTINVSADLSGMAEVMQMLTTLSSRFFIILFGCLILYATVRFPYKVLASVLKWLAAVLFSYVITAFIVHPHWPTILAATFVPHWPSGHAQWMTLVAILGTTISPYLFFLAGIAGNRGGKNQGPPGRTTIGIKGTRARYRHRHLLFQPDHVFHYPDRGADLDRHGVTHLESSRDAVQALRPLAGDFAALLYSVGLIGVGFLAIPTLAGSSAYAFSETFDLHQGLDKKLHEARAFYGILICSIVVGMGLSFTSIRPMDALFLTAVINGLLAPFLLVGILMVACDRKIMQNQPSSLLARILVTITTIGMFLAAAALFLI